MVGVCGPCGAGGSVFNEPFTYFASIFTVGGDNKPMKRHRRIGVVLSFVLAVTRTLAAAERQPSQKFTGTSLPEPPRQHDPWTAPKTSLRPQVISTVELLFQLGVADPRGCDYCEVSVPIGNLRNGDSGIQETHAWAFHTDGANAASFAVCWNGLVYPTESVGKTADLNADVDAIISRDHDRQLKWLADDRKTFQQAKEAGADWVTSNPYLRGFGPYEQGNDESGATSFTSMCPIKLALLLRLNDTTLAEAYYAQLQPGKVEDAGSSIGSRKKDADDPYLLMAADWEWMTFNRGAGAHVRGDDVISVECARLAAKAHPIIETTAAARSFERPMVYNAKINQSLAGPYLGFLELLPPLLADEERRVAEGKIDRVLDHPEEYPNKPQRIAALVRDLEEMPGQQWEPPDSFLTTGNPLLLAMDKEGEDSVEPLLECLATDKRLTRQVNYTNFDGVISLQPVSEVALEGLQQVLHLDQLTIAGKDLAVANPKTEAAQIRAFWQENRDLTPQERWYKILDNNAATPAQWLDAASRIVLPQDTREGDLYVNAPYIKNHRDWVMRGEILRSKVNPSITELLTRRALQTGLAQFAFALAWWEPAAAMPVLRTQIRSAGNGGDITDLCLSLANLGAKEPLKEYAEWIRNQKPDERNANPSRRFEPMWENPDDPDAASAANWVFNDPASPWRCLAKVENDWDETTKVVETPLLGLAGFQKSVIANLADKSPLPITIGNWGVLNPRSFTGGPPSDPADPLTPKPGDKITVRVCDWYAAQLSDLDGAPDFEEYWPETNRDAAITEFVRFIQDWGNQFRWNSSLNFPDSPGITPLARMSFERRNRPATKADVAAHTAIFSLEGLGQVRVVPLDSFPAGAVWTTYWQAPVRLQSWDKKAHAAVYTDAFDQFGLVWQGEEVLKDGHWERYYGFVRNHVIAQVPASEIRFAKWPDYLPTTRP
jgi:hypothetical protein